MIDRGDWTDKDDEARHDRSPPPVLAMNSEALIQEIIEDIRDRENENVLVAKMRMLAGTQSILTPRPEYNAGTTMTDDSTIYESQKMSEHELADFEQPATCPKCGSDDMSMKWWKAGAIPETLANGYVFRPVVQSEHLALECSDCEYKWAMRPKDK